MAQARSTADGARAVRVARVDVDANRPVGATRPTRRSAIWGAAALVGGAALAACGAGGGSGGPAGDGAAAPSKLTGTVRFATWASGPQAEMKQQQLDAYNQLQTGVRAVLET